MLNALNVVLNVVLADQMAEQMRAQLESLGFVLSKNKRYIKLHEKNADQYAFEFISNVETLTVGDLIINGDCSVADYKKLEALRSRLQKALNDTSEATLEISFFQEARIRCLLNRKDTVTKTVSWNIKLIGLTPPIREVDPMLKGRLKAFLKKAEDLCLLPRAGSRRPLAQSMILNGLLLEEEALKAEEWLGTLPSVIEKELE